MWTTWKAIIERKLTLNLRLFVAFPFCHGILDRKSPSGTPLIRAMSLEPDSKALLRHTATSHHNHDIPHGFSSLRSARSNSEG
jgi:hypothetical protein